MKKSLWGYRGEDDVPFLKITLTEPRTVPKIRDESIHNLSHVRRSLTISISARIFDRGECNYQNLFEGEIPTYESNMAFNLRFMIDTKASTIVSTVKYT